MVRDELQEEIAQAFCDLEIRRALAVLGTGFGKSKVAFLIIEKLKPKHILFLVESTINRDVTIKQEFSKWGMENYLERTEFSTYQTAYKWKKKKKSLEDYLIICDEADFAFTTEYGKFFKEYQDIDTFAMTGYVTLEKYNLFKDILPILVNIPVSELQKENILNKTIFRIVQYPLGTEKNIEVKYKKNGVEDSFQQSENDAYLYFKKQEDQAVSQLMEAISKQDEVMIKNREKFLYEELPKFTANFLHSLRSSVLSTKNIIYHLLKENPKNKIITFSIRTANADKISENSYHGKVPEKEAMKRFEDFCSGKINILSTCSKVNRGVTIPELNYAIMESFTSSITDMTQKNGRLCRLGTDEVGIIYLLIPYYFKDDVYHPTRAAFWARKIVKQFPDIKIEVINRCGNYKVEKT